MTHLDLDNYIIRSFHSRIIELKNGEKMVYHEEKYRDNEVPVIKCKNVETRVDSNTLQIVDEEKLELLYNELYANSNDYIEILFAHLTTIITTKDNIIDAIQKIIKKMPTNSQPTCITILERLCITL